MTSSNRLTVVVLSLVVLMCVCGIGPSNRRAMAQASQRVAANGEALYVARCAGCHDAGVTRAPTRAALSRLSVEHVRFAMTQGTMAAHAATFTPGERDAVAAFLTTGTSAPAASPAASPAANRCEATPPPNAPLTQPHWNGWGGNLAQHRFQPAAMARLAAAQVPSLKLKWAFGYPGVAIAYGQPTIVGGRLFAGSAGRKVYSLNARTGCQYWEFDTDAPVRAAITIGINGQSWVAYVGDQMANVYALDALTGALLWKTRIQEYPGAVITGAPTLAGNTLYAATSSSEEGSAVSPTYACCRFRGAVVAIDVTDGRIRWKSYTIPDAPRETRLNSQGIQLWGPSGAGVWSSPTVDERARRVYVTTGDSYSDPAAATADAFLAFDADSGRLLWSRQTTSGDAYTMGCGLPVPMNANCPTANGPDFDFGSSPILLDLPNGRRALIAGQKSGVVHAVDAETGAILWQTRIGQGGRVGGVQWGSATDGARVYVALSDVSMGMPPAGARGAQPTMIGIPLLLDSKAGGGLFALDPQTGRIAWTTPHPGCGDTPGCSPAQSAAVTAIPGVVFSGGLDGHLRAYAAADGRVLWDVNTVREYTTVNGVKNSGGSLDGPGPVIVDGMLYVNSGYAFIGGIPGNVLLAFSVDGR